jgi:predicted Zn-dependent peptidase
MSVPPSSPPDSVAGLLYRGLSNGVRLVGVPMPSQSVCFALNIKRGSIHEPAHLNGITHLLEHLLFHGTQRRSNAEIQDAIARLGAQVNALTSWPGVCCYARVLRAHWEPCLRLLTEVTTQPLFTRQAFDTERVIVHQEKTRTLANPRYMAIEALMASRYRDHALGRPIIGTDDTLAAISLADLTRHFAGILRPGHLTLVVAGTFNWDEVCGAAAEQLGAMPASVAGPPADPPPPAATGPMSVREDPAFPNTHLAYLFPAPAYPDDDYYAAQLLATILGDENRTSSRLSRSLERSGMAHEVFSSYQGFDDHGILYTYASAAPDDATAVHRTILNEFARLCDVTDAEVQRACRKMLSRIALDGECTHKRALSTARLFTGSGRLAGQVELSARFLAVTAEDVRRLIVRYAPAQTWTGVALGAVRALSDALSEER